MRITNTLILLFMLWTGTPLKAQQRSPGRFVTIKGVVLSDSSGVLPFATIAILHARDSSVATHTITDSLGNFEMVVDLNGIYFLSVSHIGYLSYYSGLFNPDTTKGNVTRFSVRLTKKDSQLSGVEVIKSPPLIERKLDRLIIRVDNNLVSNGESVIELLRTLPGIILDASDNIYIKGKSDIRVFIDGHDTYQKGDQLKTLLGSIPANNVQKIEIISNPPAKYAAEGAGGIINIITKTKEITGLSGNIYSTWAQGVYGTSTSGVRATFKDKSLVFSGSYDYSHGTGFIQGDEVRQFPSPSPPVTFQQLSYHPTTATNQYFKFGVDWALASNQNIAISLDGAFSKKNSPYISTLDVFQNPTTIDSSFAINNLTTTRYSNTNLNVNYNVQIDTTGQSLQVDYSHVNYNTNAANSYNSLYFDSDHVATLPPAIDTSYNKANIHVNAYKVDYKRSLPGKITLETGLKYTSTTTDNNIQYYTLQNNQFVIDTAMSDHFIYTENIAAAYVSATRDFKKVTIQLGLRYEHTREILNLTTDTLVIYRHLSDFFPTLFLEYRINKSNKINFTSGRRIERPFFAALNPFAFYFDPFSYEIGNPYLLPEYTINNELTYTYKDENSVSLGYSYTNNFIDEITLQNDTSRTVVYQYENISNSSTLYLETFIPWNITHWWSSNADLTVSYTAISGNASYGTFSNKLAGVNLNYSNTFTVGKIYTLQANVLYSSPELDGISELKSRGRLSLGAKRSFFNKAITVNCRFADVLYTDKERLTTTSLNEDISLRQVRDTRRVGLTVTYNFKKGSKFKERNVQFGGQEEKNRISITPKAN